MLDVSVERDLESPEFSLIVGIVSKRYAFLFGIFIDLPVRFTKPD